MSFFESLLILLLVAVVLLQFSRRLGVPYPSMLAIAGAAVALVPGMPYIALDPHVALALFIAPALMDAAFDFPVGTAKRFWLPLLVFAIGGVIVTAACVAWIGWAFAGLPFAAALVLGAIVAPPDAAAATAVLSSMTIPRDTDTILRGESLFNDAAALLIFDAALAIQSAGGVDREVALHLGLAVPGGIALGLAAAWAAQRLRRFVAGTLGGIVLQFVQTFLLWIIAERLELSAVLAIVTFAMAMARSSPGRSSTRMRVQSYAVWTVVVFVLNVMAFLLMGMQVRDIVREMEAGHLGQAIGFALVVIAVVVVVRLVICFGFNRIHAWFVVRRGEPEPATVTQSLLAGWCGMRGLVTLATAFALPADFPQRDIVVLTAFAVVLATLVVQGLTLTPIIRWLNLDRREAGHGEMIHLRGKIAQAGLSRLKDITGPEAELLRSKFSIERTAVSDETAEQSLNAYRKLALKAIAAQREKLEYLRSKHLVNVEEYNFLLEEIDWRELSVLPADARRIEEI
ncbi:sodium:proton antiporter [Rhizobiales bacterium RZME27]|uniref:Sodium:proton antiporter n=1 Tax=Endobacterium cereale TaxID=2663029 RepID=A0A6A8A8X3_9HYPH|nr:cation:proton antiporter [Endobacterium cereale]MEB2846854.1 cation:proton antiporter [Endobacterium cereale]MQY47725.1 sodium:proton antiporter [Endobacterium cereale]